MSDNAPLDTTELANRWKMKPGTLEIWRHRGIGPNHFKLGEGKKSRVLYRYEDVIAYEKAQAEKTAGASAQPN